MAQTTLLASDPRYITHPGRPSFSCHTSRTHVLVTCQELHCGRLPPSTPGTRSWEPGEHIRRMQA